MKKSILDKEIESVLEFLACHNPNEEDYTKAVNNLKVLYEIKFKRKIFHIEPETIFTVLVGFIEILVVVKHEEFNVISSKAFNRIRTL